MILKYEKRRIWKTVESDSDCANLQMDVDALLRWSDQWLLYFHPEKCKVMSLGHSLYSISHVI